jgi:hypothetical protein
MDFSESRVSRERQFQESILSVEEVEILTGREGRLRQCEALVAMKIPFTINILRKPLVPRSAIDGTAAEARREVKLIQQHMDMALHGIPKCHVDAYHQDVERCTGLVWKGT